VGSEFEKKSLDLGSGPSPRNPFNAAQVFGIDLRAGFANIISADLAFEKIPFDDQFFDYVTAFDFI